MDRIPPDLMGCLTPAALQDALRVLREMNEEDQEVQEAWNRTTLNFHEEISNLAASNEADEAKWQIDRASLLAAAEAARQEERRRLQASLLQLAQEAQEVCHQATLLRMAPIQGRHAIAQADHTGTQADHSPTQPEHAIAQAEHAIVQPEHAIAQPEHGIAQPEDGIAQPEHTIAQPEDSIAQPEDGITQPEHAITQPEHSITQPEHAITQPEDSVMGLAGSSTMDLEQLQAQEKGERMGLVLERDLVLERVKAWSGTLVVDGDATSAAHKQRLMADLREQADRWMEAPMAAGDSNTPEVFLTWGLREQWRKVQGNRPVLNDHLKAFLHKDAIEKQVRKHAQKERELDAQFEIKRRSLEDNFLKKEEKLRAAAEKQRERLEQQLRKEAKKRMRAAAKAQKKREEKEKKEAEKAARKRAREEKREAERQMRRERSERGSSRCSLMFCFWRSATGD